MRVLTPFVAAVVLASHVSAEMKIINVMMENRAFDHLLGWSAKELKINGLTGMEWNPVNSLDPNSERVYVKPIAQQAVPMDPDHTTFAYADKIFSAKSLLSRDYKETMMGFVEWERMKNKGNNATADSVMYGYNSTTLPVMNQLAAEFAIFDNFFASMQGPTWPNRQMAMAASTGQRVQNTETFFWEGGIPGNFYDTPTIFDQIVEAGMDWQLIYQDVPWENFYRVIAENPQKSRRLDVLYQQLRDCTSATKCALPAYTFVNPRGGVNISTGEGSNDMHPTHLVYLAEALYRDIYQAVRASPLWATGELTLLISFDEGGGYFDGVVPPQGVPAPYHVAELLMLMVIVSGRHLDTKIFHE
jgi:phospholipase C